MSMKTASRVDKPTSRQKAPREIPQRFWIGIVLVAIWWPIAWLQIRPLSDNYFFPIWLGYILVVDGLVFWRDGTSLIHRSRWRVTILFVLSAPLWWLFEGFNLVLDNWHYTLPAEYGRIEYAARAMLPFATVIPAVFVTSELVRSLRFNPLRRLPRMELGPQSLTLLHAAGWLMLSAIFIAPQYAFPLVWLSLFFIIDPLATAAGGRSIGSFLRIGDWSPVFNIGFGTLICGFFWEMWNFYALPRWAYSVPYVDFWRVFEMPLLGYGGYIPFGLEIFSFVVLVAALGPRLKIPLPRVSWIEPN
jgi:hypothetical protein